MTIYSRPSIQNVNNRRFGIWKNKCIIKLNKNQPDIDKIYFYVKDPYEYKYQYLISICEKVGLKRFNDPKAFIEYSNDMCNVYRNINYYNPDKENKILIVSDDMIADMIQNKKLNSINTELFIRGRKLNISLGFITQSYFKVPKDFRLNSTHLFVTKMLRKTGLHQIAINHQILVLKILSISIENVLLNHIHFLLMILHSHQIIL